jgi:hypothetical protein
MAAVFERDRRTGSAWFHLERISQSSASSIARGGGGGGGVFPHCVCGVWASRALAGDLPPFPRDWQSPRSTRHVRRRSRTSCPSARVVALVVTMCRWRKNAVEEPPAFPPGDFDGLSRSPTEDLPPHVARAHADGPPAPYAGVGAAHGCPRLLRPCARRPEIDPRDVGISDAVAIPAVAAARPL